MEIKDGLEKKSTTDFYYDLMVGCYISPFDFCKDPKDIKRLFNAITVIQEFEESIEQKYPEFFQ